MDSEDRTEFFEEGFEGFPRHLPENCVEYILVIIDNQLEGRKQLSALENLRKAAVQLCDELTKDYIWQRDPFRLDVRNEKELFYLQGTTYYGDSVEDEWLIVYLLRQLTKSFPNLWARVYDSDGEFLLIEAANVLPSWLSPEIDSNRVWIHQEKLYVVPPDVASTEKRALSLAEAVSFLRKKPEALVHSSFIEEEAFYRLAKYPSQIERSVHHSLVKIPRKLAYVLHQKPAAIAPAVEAFYLRDPLSMKHLLSEAKKLKFPPEDLVTVSVRFTKVLFAQLKSQQFTPPPIWDPIIEAAEKGVGDEGRQKLLDQLDLGIKVTSGFEMLAVNAETKDNRIAREVALLLEDIEEDGIESLPNDAVMRSWPNVSRDDDESWLDINFEDFERELDGKRRARKGKQTGFGDAAAQADLQKIVSRFESFLNDDGAGLEGAEMDDMDEDDDSDEEEDDSEEEDKEVSFDEQQFSQMMKEMMGLPPDESSNSGMGSDARAWEKEGGPVEEMDEDEDEAEDIRRLASQMEAELNEFGALKIDSGVAKQKSLGGDGRQNTKGKQPQPEDDEDSEHDESGDEEVDVDYNLAKNLLESFKSQAGMAGPAGNILGMMGMQLPRDEDQENEM